MSIVHAARLSADDLARLGNNVSGPRRRRACDPGRAARRVLASVNRSLARVGERVDRLTVDRLTVGRAAPAAG